MGGMSKHKTAKATTSKAGSARARLAAEQAAQEQRRRRMILVVVPIAVVLVAVLALVGARVLGIGTSNGDTVAGPVDGSVVTKATSVPADVLNQVGIGSSTGKPKAIQAPALTEDGKPKILYIGAEYCPYCATERWAMVVALSRFGTFSNLGQTASSADDVYPSTATLSFHGSSYTSSNVAFTGVETQGEQGVALDTLSAADQQIESTYNAPPYVPADSQGAIPFVDIGGKYLINGASYKPQVLQGKTHAEIADALSNPDSAIAKGVDGTANMITAAICATTNNAPANVCTSAGVTAAAGNLS